MRSTHALILKRAHKPNTSIQTSEPIDFTLLSDTASSISISPVQIKRPSKTLPSEYVTNKHDAFRMGAKTGTGSKMFYGVIPNIKEAIGLSPVTKKGKLVDAINQARNDGRTLNENIKKLRDQFDRVMTDSELSFEVRLEAAQLALYFLEKSLMKLQPILVDLKIYMGLLKGNAIIGMGGFIVAGKEPLNEKHPYLAMKEREQECELRLLQELANDDSILQSAIYKLEEIGLSDEDFQRWKRHNRTKIDESLNTFKGAGNITGIAIQGVVFSAINFGIAGATLNPIVFAAGTYYAASAVVRICEVAARTRLQNNIIREALYEPSDNIAEDGPESKNKAALHQSRINIVDGIEKVHHAVDIVANTGFMVGATTFQLPVSTDRPRLYSDERTVSIAFKP